MLDLNVFLTLAVAVLLTVVPGLLLALALRMRGWAAVGAAPLLTVALVLVAIVVVSLAGVDWTPVSAAAVALAGIAVAFVGAGALEARARRRSRRPVDPDVGPAGPAADPADDADERESRLWSLLAVAGVVLGAVIGFATLVPGTDGLTSANQGFDALFHVNLIENITRSGDVAPSVAGDLNGYPDGASVYPDAFHAMASLVDQVHGTSLTSTNALLTGIPLVAGLGLVALLRTLGLVRAAAVAPVVLASTSGFPIDLIWRGPVWVFAFGIALVPAFLVLLARTLDRRDTVTTVGLGLATAGLALMHPSAALTAAVFGICLVVGRWLQRGDVPARDVLRRDLVVLVPAAAVAAVLALPLIGQALVDTGGGTVVDWPIAQSPGEAVGELLFYNYDNDHPQLWLAIAALVGLAVGWRSPQLRWWYAATGVFVLLCVMAAAYEGRLVQLLTGPWWNDRFRFKGVVFLGLSVFAAVGVTHLGGLLAGLVRRVTTRWHERMPALRTPALAAAGVVVVLALVGVLSGFYVQENRDRLATAYVPGGGGSVSDDDLAAFDVLRDLAGAGPVLNDPNDGSAWMWALADVQPVFGAALTVPVKPPLPEERQLVVDGLNCLDSSERVRQAVEDLGVRYVYSSASTILGGETTNPGFRDLSSVDSLRPVYEGTGVTIYEIDPVPLEESADAACELT
ncbi:hypothetical protein GCU56_08870 [Geodermatophilus sabuli]|uniref:Uncharacterized protein n=1 Tax=Geodermatophilus sabuli TaxID=1564158 RepID=A0A7K3VZF2_9ACTN|nr:DUF6541 family protein [Geodermatophilus sabuli]NEK57982.1 hypothetical protein [Geodermatophilus sabuli]